MPTREYRYFPKELVEPFVVRLILSAVYVSIPKIRKWNVKQSGTFWFEFFAEDDHIEKILYEKTKKS